MFDNPKEKTKVESRDEIRKLSRGFAALVRQFRQENKIENLQPIYDVINARKPPNSKQLTKVIYNNLWTQGKITPEELGIFMDNLMLKPPQKKQLQAVYDPIQEAIAKHETSSFSTPTLH